jgi:hypothetical protein
MEDIRMNKFLVAIAVAAVLSNPALAKTTPQTDKASVQASHSAQSNSDDYWKPCHFSRYGGMNTCD